MPGAYHFDTSGAPGQALNAGLFRPPGSPSTSSSVYNLAKSSGSLYSDLSMANTPVPGAKRKRTRPEVWRGSTPMADWADGAAEAADDDRSNPASHQIRYTLAGQIDTPGGAAPPLEVGALEDSVYSDIDYRRALGSKRQREDADSPREEPLTRPYSNQLPIPDAAAPTARPEPNAGGWSAFALSALGEVVGKVWEFCTAGAFKGFHAGGGRGYEIDQGRVSATIREAGDTENGGEDREDHQGHQGHQDREYREVEDVAQNGQDGRPWCNEHDIPTLQTEESPPMALPGSFMPAISPEPDYAPLYPVNNSETSSPDSTPRPAPKRRQLNGEHEELRQNWVMVSEPSPHPPPDPGKRRSFVPTPSAPSRTTPMHRPQNLRYSAPTAASNSRRMSIPVSRLNGASPSVTPASRRTSLRISHACSPSFPPRPPSAFSHSRPSSSLSTTPGSGGSGSRIPVPSQPPGLGPNPFALSSAAPTGSKITNTTTSRPSSRQSAIPSPAHGLHRRTQSSLSSAPNTPARRRGAGSTGSAFGGLNHRGAATSTPVERAVPAVAADDGAASSPRLDAEARQLAERRRAAERDADVRMEAFNKQLMDMIRQGREALGTSVDVEMDMSGGWEDDEI